ncbi:ATP dependent DNA ligase [Arthrobacter crystallopoietes BAB-32]|uniref:ATP dependent DNA ligase n=1 Tax=Arthrobacter crystallopoietes BAB-32 TaxID=1246476 RepID=N1UWX5_9MICC|nr:ATP dependent DNA ligase [Arthrobacter crystallopoietes BAB-32]
MPADLRPPVAVALARGVDAIPKADALPGGCRYEPKWDGFRAALIRDSDSTALWSRQGKDLTRWFPDLIKAAEAQIPPGCIIDGEAVIWSGDRLDFETLQRRLITPVKSLPGSIREHPANFAAFDLLAVAGKDARRLPLHSRRELLEELAKDWEPPLGLSSVTDDPEQAARWLEELHPAGIEGLMIKGANQRYEGGERQWLKVKHRHTLDVVCAAVTGPIEKPQTLIAGLPIGHRLRIVGRTVPLKATAAKALGKLLVPAGPDHPWPERIRSTILDRFNPDAEDTVLTRVEPIVIEVSADVAWSGKSFRHPLRFLRARPELDADEVELPAHLLTAPPHLM